MRNMSFSLTTNQFLDGSKTVTRRLGWLFLKVEDRVMAIEKGQGLKKGQKIKRLGVIETLAVHREQLSYISSSDVIKEGFPEMTTGEFIRFFCQANSCFENSLVSRIEFKRIKSINKEQANEM